jgi:hypothetical protein
MLESDIVDHGLAIQQGTKVVPLASATLEVEYSADIQENRAFTKMDVLIYELDKNRNVVPGTSRVYQIGMTSIPTAAGKASGERTFNVKNWRRKVR